MDSSQRKNKIISARITLIFILRKLGYAPPTIYKYLKMNHSTYLYHMEHNKFEHRVRNFPEHAQSMKKLMRENVPPTINPKNQTTTIPQHQTTTP